MSQSSADIADATPAGILEELQRNGAARLVDVRTRAEWAYVGLPDLSDTGTDPILLEWQTFPDMTVDPQFGQALERACPDKDAPLFFLCRSGVRSVSAAREMKGRGYAHVFNIKDGFEGPLDASGHRGRVAGWKALSLPWRQT